MSQTHVPGAGTTIGVHPGVGDRLLVTNSRMDTYRHGTPLTSPAFTLETFPCAG